MNIRNKGREIFMDYFTNWLTKDAAARERAVKLSNARKSKKQAAKAA